MENLYGMDEWERAALDEQYTAIRLLSNDAHVFLYDMQHDVSRWSSDMVHTFGLPSTYMKRAECIWEKHIHVDDRENYRKSMRRIFSGMDMRYNMQYRVKNREGEYEICTCRGVVLRDAIDHPRYFAGVVVNHGDRSYIDTLTGLRDRYGFFSTWTSSSRQGAEWFSCSSASST